MELFLSLRFYEFVFLSLTRFAFICFSFLDSMRQFFLLRFKLVFFSFSNMTFFFLWVYVFPLTILFLHFFFFVSFFLTFFFISFFLSLFYAISFSFTICISYFFFLSFLRDILSFFYFPFLSILLRNSLPFLIF